MADKVKLGFIGAGGIVKKHLEQGLSGFDDVEFVGWCDLNAETAEACRAQVGGRGEVYRDAARMLDEAKPDAVFVMLPPFAHGPAERLVIERRIPFFVEKPVGIDMATVGEIAEGVRAHGLVTAVGYMNRYRDSVARVRELLSAQTPVLLHGGWLGGGPKEASAIFSWWTRKDRSGGQLVEQTTHTLDLARYLFGEVTRVYAAAAKDRRERPAGYTIEDASMVQLSFANGAAGNIYSSCATSVGGGVCLSVWGTDMRADFSGWGHAVKISLPDTQEESIAAEPDIFAKEDRAFIDSVKAGKTVGILATYEDGYKATEIACAANRSMETGEVVDLA
jgi:predicted dehydrogenase